MHIQGNPWEEDVAIGDEVRVCVVAIRGQRVCLGIAAPPGLSIRGLSGSSKAAVPLAAHATDPPSHPKTRCASKWVS